MEELELENSDVPLTFFNYPPKKCMRGVIGGKIEFFHDEIMQT